MSGSLSISRVAQSLSADIVIQKVVEKYNGEWNLACTVHCMYSFNKSSASFWNIGLPLPNTLRIILGILTFSLPTEVIFVRFLFVSPAFAHPWLILALNEYRMTVDFGKDAEGSIFFLYLRTEEEGPSHARVFPALKLSPKILSPCFLKGFNALKLGNSSAIWKWSQFFLLQVLQGQVLSCGTIKQTTSTEMGGNREYVLVICIKWY